MDGSTPLHLQASITLMGGTKPVSVLAANVVSTAPPYLSRPSRPCCLPHQCFNVNKELLMNYSITEAWV